MSDFIALAQTFGLPLASYLVAVIVLSRVIVSISREKDRISESRFTELKAQYDARIEELKRQSDARIEEITEDRDWCRDRLYHALGGMDAGTATVEEMVRRISKQLPPARGGRG